MDGPPMECHKMIIKRCHVEVMLDSPQLVVTRTHPSNLPHFSQGWRWSIRFIKHVIKEVVETSWVEIKPSQHVTVDSLRQSLKWMTWLSCACTSNIDMNKVGIMILCVFLMFTKRFYSSDGMI